MMNTDVTEKRDDTSLACRNLSHFCLEERLLIPYENDRAVRASGQRVAIIGAGPAGLSAANILAQLGYEVTVFESLSVIGGMLAVGIPAYRRPAELVERMTAIARQPEIDVRLRTVIGRDLSFQQLQERFDAILLAVGLQQSVPLGISGEAILQGVVPAIDFLKRYHQQQARVRGDVAVIGGGIATIDVARLAIRAGAHSVRVFLPGAVADLPALPEEREAAEKEGVVFHPGEMPRSILGTEDVNVHGVRCQNTLRATAEVMDRQSFTYILGTDRRYFLSTVLVAVGETTDLSCLSGVDCRFSLPQESHKSEEATCATNLPGVFVAGDAASRSPASRTLLHAFTGGYEAAHAMHVYLCSHRAAQDGTRQQTAMPASC